MPGMLEKKKSIEVKARDKDLSMCLCDLKESNKQSGHDLNT